MTQTDMKQIISDVGSDHIVVMSHKDFRKIADALTQEQRDKLNGEISSHEYQIKEATVYELP